MKPFLERLAVALCSGYIIVYYGEFVFWATPDREGMNVGGIIAVWLLYSIMAYPFLCVVNYFKVRDPWPYSLQVRFTAGSRRASSSKRRMAHLTPHSPCPSRSRHLHGTRPSMYSSVGIWCAVSCRKTSISRPSRLPAALASSTASGESSGGTNRRSL